jgi:hypothetical protein
MSKQTINVGSTELAGDGESIRSAFVKANSNFTELYTQVPLATSATYAMSFNTSTLVAIAVTATYAQSYDPAPVFTYLAATTSSQYVGRAVTATYATSFNTATVVGRAVTATNIVNGTWTLSLSTAGSILLNGTVFSSGAGSATTSTLVNGTWTVSLSSDSVLTIPPNGLIIASTGTYGQQHEMRLGDGLMIGQDGSLANYKNVTWSLQGQNSDSGTQIRLPGQTDSDNGMSLLIQHLYTNTSIDIQSLDSIWSFRSDGTVSFPYAALDGGTAPIELKSRSWSQLTYNNVDMTPAPNKNHSTTFYVEGGDALLEIFRWDGSSVLQHRQWTFSSDGSLSLPDTGTITFPDATIQTTAYTGPTSTSTLVNGTWTTSLSSSGTVFLPNGLQTASTGSLNLFTNYSSGNINIGGISPTINMGSGQVNIGYLNTRIVFGYSGVLTAGTTFSNFTGTPITGSNLWSTPIATGTNGNGGPQNGVPLSFTVRGAGGNYVSVQQNFYNQGQNYAVGDTITIAGTQLGGTSPANDLTFTIGSEVGNTYPNLGPGSLVFDYGLGRFFGYVQNDNYTNPSWSRLDNTSSSTLINGSAIVSLSTAGTVTITGTAIAISTQTGALQVTGGVGIGGNLYVGGEIVAQKLTIQYTTVTTTLVQTDDIISTYNTTASKSTNTGALQIAGGVGIGGGVFVGGSVTATNFVGNLTGTASTATYATSFNTSTLVANAVTATYATSFNTSTLVANAVTATYATSFNTATVVGNAVTATIVSAAAQLNITSVGTLTNLTVNGTVTATNFILNGYQVSTSTGGITSPYSGIFTSTNTSSAVSTTTGALQVAGGIGIGGGVFVGGTVTATTFTGLASAGTTATTAAALGYIGMPQNSTASSYTLVAGDQGKHIYITATGQTITIPANASVPFPIGTSIAFIAGPSATTVSIAITTDTMYLGGSGTSGTRTLVAYGMATAVKVAATTWFINGTGLT